MLYIKYVPLWMYKRIQVGNYVIEVVKNLLRFGPGNMVWSGRESMVRTYAAQSMATRLNPDVMHHPRNLAAGAIKFRAGNCQDQASVAYTILREAFDASTLICFCSCPSEQHSFATIGTQYENGCVVVDAWPRFAQAVLLEDHFVYGHPIVVFKSGYGKGVGGFEKAVAKGYAFDEVAYLQWAQAQNFQHGQWTVTHCTSDNRYIQYRGC